MTAPLTVDSGAPVVVRHSMAIDAPIDRVWELHTAVSRWPEWQHDITQVSGTPTIEVGTDFTWTSFGFTVTSTVFAVEPGSRVLWGGEAGGILGIHEWTFESTDGGTLVSTAESFAGAPVEAARDELRAQLDFSLTSWLGHLKAAAERD